MGSVWIAGSYQSDFARNFAREGLEISDMVAEALQGTLRSAGLEPEDVESIHVGNAFGQLFTGQGQLGAMPATVVTGPVVRQPSAATWLSGAPIPPPRTRPSMTSASSRASQAPRLSAAPA